ncbi:hypothetical protein AVEN_220971-1 [Araneus ventricosus]|uniref:Tc1-like transposase DDE domain-containing protein n=1 Tax=Araneus ventricosus TaxID=182803 RepID=A0A4Y2NIH0_ARAVE|nr:hypothetical protein AVEN_220971-1 [Araneus ventricosus]
MIWGCFNGSGLGLAVLCDSKMKSQHYLNVLNDQVIPSMDFFFPDASGIFQENNAKIHRVLIIHNWLREHEDSFSKINWSPQCPMILTQSKIFGIYWNNAYDVVHFFRRQFSVSVRNC